MQILICHGFWSDPFKSNTFSLSQFYLSNATVRNNVFKEKYNTE